MSNNQNFPYQNYPGTPAGRSSGPGGIIAVAITAALLLLAGIAGFVVVVLSGGHHQANAAVASNLPKSAAASGSVASTSPAAAQPGTDPTNTGQGSVAPHPPVTVPPPAPTTALAASATSTVPSYTGPCAGTTNKITFSSTISVTRGPSTVHVVWDLDTGYTSPEQLFHFTSSGLQQLTMPYTVSGLTGIHTGWAQAHAWISGGASVVSNKVAWTVTCTQPHLALSAGSVADGNTYAAYASGFLAGESVQFLYGGPTTGVITTVTATSSGTASVTVNEYAAPGSYFIYARGLSSSGSASAPLTVTAAAPHLILSTSSVARGSNYTATATHFAPGETVTFTWTGLSSGTISSVVANSAGTATLSVHEGTGIATGAYVIHAHGGSSGDSAAAALQVT